MFENPYEPPKVECREWRFVDHAGNFFSAGLTGLIAGYGAHYVADAALAALANRGTYLAAVAFQYGPTAAGILAGKAWAIGWYLVAIHKARRGGADK